MHVGVFILLLLSGERNFGVRLNKLYLTRVPMDLPIFTGNHADLLILVRFRHGNPTFINSQNGEFRYENGEFRYENGEFRYDYCVLSDGFVSQWCCFSWDFGLMVLFQLGL